MKYLKLVETIPSDKEEGVLYCEKESGKVGLKKAEPTPTIELVDLGLPSGTLWMKYNIGANSETDYGLLFQWGATEGHDYDTDAKDYSTWDTAPFNGGNSSYNSTAFASVSGTACPNGVLAPQYDAAYQATNGVAHMPTKEDFEELTANTTSEFVNDFNGSSVNGRKFTASNGNYIFIPHGGWANVNNVNYKGSEGYFWTSNLSTNYIDCSWYFESAFSYKLLSQGVRLRGCSVRGVVSKN